MIYKIDWSEVIKQGETNGRPWKMSKMTLIDEQGKQTEGVTTFDAVITGTNIEGEIVQKGEYLNFVTKKAENKANFKNAQMEKVIERKEQSISRFQDSKEWSIKLASSMGKAIDLAIAEGDMNNESRKLAIRNWREWILKAWDVEPTDIPPFN